MQNNKNTKFKPKEQQVVAVWHSWRVGLDQRS